MDTFSKIPIMMDICQLEIGVRQKAEEYLGDISEENLRLFAESTKFLAQSILENYYLSVDELFSNGAKKIALEEVRDKFMDFSDGYRAKMRNWVSDNNITIDEMEVDPNLVYPKMPEYSIHTKPLLVASVGTLVAVGLYIFTDVWVAVAAELLVLGTAAYLYKSEIDKHKEYAYKLRTFELQIEKERARLINGLIKDLKTWLSNAKQYSDEIINNFGI